MKLLRNINIWRMLKIICIVLCAVFLFAACDSHEEGQIGPGKDAKDTIESQHDCYMEIDTEKGTSKMICPYETTAGANETPEKNSDFKSGSQDCIQASLLKLIYSGLGKMASSVYSKVTNEDLLSLMFLAFSIWMAFQILRHISATTPESLGEFWTKILRKATLCVACGILASSPENLYYAVNTFVLPIYVTLLEFASAILEILDKSNNATSLELPTDIAEASGDNTDSNILKNGKIIEEYKHSLSDSACKITDSSSIQMSENNFPSGPADMMGCMACAISDRLNVGYTIAALVMKSDGLLMTLIAIFLFVVFTFVKWGFALYLVDSIFRLTMMIIIMPFLILFFPFEQTRKWTTVGFKVILNSAGIMLCLAILVGTTVYAMDSLVQSGDYGSQASYVKFGATPLSLIFMGFVVVKISGLAVSLSDSVTGGGGATRFQKKMAALVGTLANALFLIITMGAGAAVSAAAAHSQRIKTMVEKAQKAKAKIDKIKRKMNQLAGRPNPEQGQAEEEGEV